MKLSDLQPRISPPGGAYQEIAFLCPRCQKHEIMIAIWNGSAGDFDLPLNGLPPPGLVAGKRLWHAVSASPDLSDLTITPSIDRTGLDPCGGWHGHIKSGRAE